MIRAAVALAALFALAAPAPLAADQSRAFPIRLVGILGGGDDVTQSILVGRSGELYHPTEGQRWQRQIAGGVSVEVTGAVRGPDSDVFVVGHRAPMFRFDRERGAWFAHPLPNRGPSEPCGPGGLTCVSLGRHVYLPAAGRWNRLGAATDTITAVWASTSTRVYVGTKDGGLARVTGSSRAELTHPLADGDVVVAFAGTPGRNLHALAASGTLLEVQGSSAATVTPAADLAATLVDLDLHTLAPRAAGGVWAIGVAGPPDAREALLLRAEGTTLAREATAPLPPGARAAALRVDSDGAMLLVSRGGRAWLRPAGGAWVEAEVLGTLPDAAYRPQAARAPARTR